MKRRWCPLHWALTFFGLPREHSVNLHTQIFELINYGNGFTMMDVYRMPTHLRNFYYKKLVDTKKKEALEIEKSKKQPKVRVRR